MVCNIMFNKVNFQTFVSGITSRSFFDIAEKNAKKKNVSPRGNKFFAENEKFPSLIIKV